MSTATPLPPLGGRGGPAADAPAGGRRRRLVRARAGVPAWERPALAALLLGTLVLYLWELGREGWANSYYAAAVQAGTESWKAFLFGSLDASNFITVDKPPASLWLMELSGRVFGVNAWSMLVPQAIAGVLTVWLTYRIVRRWFDAPAALLAGAALALTPVAALMFRFNNPDALLTLLLVAGAYALVRAVEAGATTWLVLAGALVGTAFLAKSLQAFLVVPAFALVWMLAAPGPLGRRALRMLAGAGALVAASAWWVAAVELTPASARPYIGGSDDNSVLSLIFGYNGLDRLSGGGGPGGGASFSGDPGVGRLFNAQMGGQIAWLLPFAAVALAAGIWSRRGTPRTDRRRAAYVLWGGWAVTHALVFSAMSGIVHSYYTVAMAPAVAALSGMGAVDMWRMRGDARTRWVLPLAVGASAVTAYVLLDRSPGFVPALKWLVLLGGLAAAAGLLVDGARLPARAAVALAALAALAVLAGPAAYAVQTAGTSHQGSTPSAGPAVTGAMGGFGGGMRGGFAGGGAMPQGAPPQGAMPQGAPPQGAMPQGGALPQGATAPQSGGDPGMAAVGDDVVAFLEANRGDARWIAATDGANAAAGIQLASGEPVMAIGGFSGRDPAPTLDEFVALVREGAVRYYVGGGSGIPGMGAGLGGDTSIAAWVQDHGTLVDTSLTGGATVYDLSGAAG